MRPATPAATEAKLALTGGYRRSRTLVDTDATGAGRPSWSSRRSSGVRSITAVKLTRSLARLGATAPRRPCPESPWQGLCGSRPHRAQRIGGSHRAWIGLPGLGRLRSSADRRCCAETDQPRAEQDDRFGRTSWPQVEQIGEIGRPRDECRVEQPVQPTAYRLRAAGPRALDHGRGGARTQADSENLDRPTGHLAGTQCPQVPAEALGLGRSVEVVVRPDRPRSDTGDGHGQASATGTVKQPVHLRRPPVRRLRWGPLRG